MAGLFLLGRILFGGFFLYNGVNHFISTAMLTEYAASKAVPFPELAVVAAGVLILVGGFNVLLGLWPHVGALCIVAFLATVSPIMHDFWAISDPAQRMAELINFTKNIALLGGSLMLLAVPRPWPYSVESRRSVVAA